MALFQFGSFEFPEKYIKFDSVDIAPNQRQDLDSYTDGYGVTHRNALAHGKTEIKFTTIEMSGQAMKSIMAGITQNYQNYNERDAQCSYCDPESGTNKTGHFYLDPSLRFRVKKRRGTEVEKYGEMEWTFIEY